MHLNNKMIKYLARGLNELHLLQKLSIDLSSNLKLSGEYIDSLFKILFTRLINLQELELDFTYCSGVATSTF